MNKTTWINTQEKGPIMKSKIGRFEISIWKWVKHIQQPEAQKDLFAERQVEVERASVSYSKWNRVTSTWERQVVWCSIDELRDLVNALDGLNFRDTP